MRLKSDLIPLLEATIDGKLDQVQRRMARRPRGLRRAVRRRLSGRLRQRTRNSRAGQIERLGQWFRFSCRHRQGRGSLGYHRRPRAGSNRSRKIYCRRRQGSLSRHRRNLLGRNALSERHRSSRVKDSLKSRSLDSKLKRADAGLDLFGGTTVANSQPKVGILMGSDSDLEVMREAEKRLDTFGIAYETHIMSAHRTPEKAGEYAATAQRRGLEVIICGAGAAAHLAGAIAANTTLPVIGIPIDSSSLKGLDALLATVQMPAGIPVATMAIGKAGAANAGSSPRKSSPAKMTPWQPSWSNSKKRWPRVSKSATGSSRVKETRAETIAAAVAALKRGEVIAFPTETLYGLGADALNHAAVEKVFQLKGRDATNPIPVLIADRAMLLNLVVRDSTACGKIDRALLARPVDHGFSGAPRYPAAAGKCHGRNRRAHIQPADRRRAGPSSRPSADGDERESFGKAARAHGARSERIFFWPDRYLYRRRRAHFPDRVHGGRTRRKTRSESSARAKSIDQKSQTCLAQKGSWREIRFGYSSLTCRGADR